MSKKFQIGQYQNSMPDLNEDRYESLKRSIERHGLEYPILVTQEGEVIDGHHRLKACRELDVEPDAIVVNTEYDPERAYRTNLARRDFSSGQKRETVKQYLLEHYDGERKQQEIADNLGVAQDTVHRALSELREAGKLTEVGEFPTEQKREMVRAYIESNAEASNRDVAEAVECDVSYRTVCNWRNEWSGEDDSTQRAYASDSEQAEVVEELFEEADSGDEDAQEIAEDVSEGKASPDKAKRDLQKKRRKERQKEREEEARESADLDILSVTITDEQSPVQCDALITDPPYGILSDVDWEPGELRSFTLDWLNRWKDCGADFIASFWSQEHLHTGLRYVTAEMMEFGYHRQQVLIWSIPNQKKHQDRRGFKRTWEPILFFRHEDSDKKVSLPDGEWGGKIKDFDLHEAPVPQSNFNDENRKEHPAQKPLSVMEWLVLTLTDPGDLVADPFCGTGTTGVAAVKHDRAFHGIEIDEDYQELSEKRIATYA